MLPIVPQSFGDIVAAAELAFKIHEALSNGAGSLHQCQCLIGELNAFSSALKFVSDTIRKTPLSGKEVEDIEAEARRCHELLQKFEECISKYEGRLNRGGLRGFFSKLKWAFVMPDKVAGFRARLAERQRVITLSLVALHM